jgi:hypothetical protein
MIMNCYYGWLWWHFVLTAVLSSIFIPTAMRIYGYTINVETVEGAKQIQALTAARYGFHFVTRVIAFYFIMWKMFQQFLKDEFY